MLYFTMFLSTTLRDLCILHGSLSLCCNWTSQLNITIEHHNWTSQLNTSQLNTSQLNITFEHITLEHHNWTTQLNTSQLNITVEHITVELKTAVWGHTPGSFLKKHYFSPNSFSCKGFLRLQKRGLGQSSAGLGVHVHICTWSHALRDPW